MPKRYFCLILTGLVFIGLFVVGVGSCQKKTSNSKTGSSNLNAFQINAPLNLTATAVSFTQINLSWIDNSNNEDGFEIYRSTDGTSFLLLTTIYSNMISYSDIAVTPFTVYYYRVRAFNSVGDRSEWSNIITVDTNILLPLVRVAAGESHTIALLTDGSLWSWGNNNSGQLGLGNDSPLTVTIPTKVGSQIDWSILVAGYYHSLAIKTNRTLWSWGANESGQLGVGDTELRTEPTIIGPGSDWLLVAGGSNHTLAIKTNKTLWSWGYNGSYQLGLDDILDRNTPTQIGNDSDWSLVGAGGAISFAVKTDPGGGGTLWAWGAGASGRLGLGDDEDRAIPTQVGVDSDWDKMSIGYQDSFGIKINSELWGWGVDYDSTTILIVTDVDWFSVSAGQEHMISIKTIGTIWSLGSNAFGQLGLGDFNSRTGMPVQISTYSAWDYVVSGGYHSLGKTVDGTVFVWGLNNNGQLGFGDTINRNIPSELGSPAPPSLLNIKGVLSSEINLSWADNSYNEIGFRIERKINREGLYEEIATAAANITTYSDISLSGFAPFIYYYYRVRAYNAFGNSPYVESYTAFSGNWADITAGFSHSVALKANGTIWSWGYNSSLYGQLGIGDTVSILRRTPSLIGSASDWADISAGGNHTLARKTDGIIWSWGRNNWGQLGLGNYLSHSTPTVIGAGSDWSMIAVGNMHSIGLKTNKTIWAWGGNTYGQLGLGNTTNKNVPSHVGSSSDWVEVYSGRESSIALKADGTIWVWGSNGCNILGLGDNLNRLRPNQLGDLPSPFLSFTGTVNSLTEVSLSWSNPDNENGFEIFRAITNNPYSLLATISSNILSCLDMTVSPITTSYYVKAFSNVGESFSRSISLVITDVGTSVVVLPFSMPRFDSDWATVNAGEGHMFAIKTNGTLWSWGDNNYCQLGLGDTVSRTTPTSIGIDSDWVAIRAGNFHSLACKTNGTLWVWGDNRYGQLGVGDTVLRSTPVLINTESDWAAISAGNFYTIARKTNGTLWAWGRNSDCGQLGLGDAINRSIPTLVEE